MRKRLKAKKNVKYKGLVGYDDKLKNDKLTCSRCGKAAGIEDLVCESCGALLS